MTLGVRVVSGAWKSLQPGAQCDWKSVGERKRFFFEKKKQKTFDSCGIEDKYCEMLQEIKVSCFAGDAQPPTMRCINSASGALDFFEERSPAPQVRRHRRT
jgi:hypothetical protein